MQRLQMYLGVSDLPFSKGLPVCDSEFDLIFTDQIRRLSFRHFTPIAIAKRAAEMLKSDFPSKILDIGSGAGKFCFVGALTSQDLYYGVEQRKALVNEAQRVCNAYRIPRVHFILGNMSDLDWKQFNGFYLFNPFFENLVEHYTSDDTIRVGIERYEFYTQTVTKRLSELNLGTRVVTYHGFGGDIPNGYELLASEAHGSDFLNLWQKTKVNP